MEMQHPARSPQVAPISPNRADDAGGSLGTPAVFVQCANGRATPDVGRPARGVGRLARWLWSSRPRSSRRPAALRAWVERTGDDLLGAGIAPVRSARLARSLCSSEMPRACRGRRRRVEWAPAPRARQDSRCVRAPTVVLAEPSASAKLQPGARPAPASSRDAGVGPLRRSRFSLVPGFGHPWRVPRRSSGARLPDSGRRWFPGHPNAASERRGSADFRVPAAAHVSSRRCRPTDPVTQRVGCGGPAPATRWRRSRATQPRGLCSPTRAGRSRSLSGKTGPTGQLLRSPPPAIVRDFRETCGPAMRRSGRLSRR